MILNRPSTTIRPTAIRYGLAVVFVSVALYLSLLLHHFVSDAFLILFFAAVMASGWFGRTGPGLFAVFMSTIAVEYYFVPPLRNLRMNLEEIPYFLTFLFSSVVASWLSSARRRAEERQRAYLDELFDQTPEAIMLLDLKGRVLRTNKEFSRMFGFTADEIAGALGMEVIVPNDLGKQVLSSKERLASGECVNMETIRTRRDGSRFSVWELAVPIIVEGERLADYVIYRDITEIKEAAVALQTAQAELAHLSRVTTMGELVASIAHEVNQPITGIKSNGTAGVHWLDMEPPDLKEARDAFARIVRDADRAGAVISRIRALLKKTVPHMEPLDVNDLIHGVLLLTNNELRRDGINLRTDLTATVPVVGDRVQLQQVMLNLIMNSIDAMGCIVDRPRELHIRSSNDDKRVVVQVEDSGVGLDPERVHSIFYPFFTTKPQGIGMGLAISQSIIEMHGGQLWATPQSKGAVFQFTLPTEVNPA